jgi:exodeoxyribonuclease VII small subunit
MAKREQPKRAKQESQELPEDMDFEAALEQLEQIVTELESGQLALEEGLQRFELAMRLREICSRKLREAEARIEEYAARVEHHEELPQPPPTATTEAPFGEELAQSQRVRLEEGSATRPAEGDPLPSQAPAQPSQNDAEEPSDDTPGSLSIEL